LSATLSPLFSWRGQIAGSKLHSTTKLVAFTLSLHMSERGDSCFPSIETLAEEASLHYDTVKDHLSKLAADGWITKTYDRSVKGRGTRVYYAASIPTTGAENPGVPAAPVEDRGAPPCNTGADNPSPREDVNESDSVPTERPDRLFVVQAEAEPEPCTETPRSRATYIVNEYWNAVKRSQQGRPPLGVRHQALVKLIEPFLEHYDDRQVTAAMATMRINCKPMTRQVLEEHLDGRAARRGATSSSDPMARARQRQAARAAMA